MKIHDLLKTGQTFTGRSIIVFMILLSHGFIGLMVEFLFFKKLQLKSRKCDFLKYMTHHFIGKQVLTPGAAMMMLYESHTSLDLCPAHMNFPALPWLFLQGCNHTGVGQ